MRSPRRQRRGGNLPQQSPAVNPGKPGGSGSCRKATEAEIRNRQVRGVVRGEQGGRCRVSLGVAPAPVVHDAHRVGVRLRVHPVDDQHPPVVPLEERLVASEGGVREVAGLTDFVSFRPVVDDRLARGVGLGVAEARGVPTAVGLDKDEELAAVLGGASEWQAKARSRSGHPEHPLENGTTSHSVSPLQVEVSVVHQRGRPARPPTSARRLGDPLGRFRSRRCRCAPNRSRTIYHRIRSRASL